MPPLLLPLIVTCVAVTSTSGQPATSLSTSGALEGNARLEALEQKGWSDGQLNPGEARQPRGKTQSLSADDGTGRRRSGGQGARRDDGRIHIGTHEFYTDSRGVRSIDKVPACQGIAVDWRCIGTARLHCTPL